MKYNRRCDQINDFRKPQQIAYHSKGWIISLSCQTFYASPKTSESSFFYLFRRKTINFVKSALGAKNTVFQVVLFTFQIKNDENQAQDGKKVFITGFETCLPRSEAIFETVQSLRFFTLIMKSIRFVRVFFHCILSNVTSIHSTVRKWIKISLSKGGFKNASPRPVGKNANAVQ